MNASVTPSDLLRSCFAARLGAPASGATAKQAATELPSASLEWLSLSVYLSLARHSGKSQMNNFICCETPLWRTDSVDVKRHGRVESQAGFANANREKDSSQQEVA